MAGFILGTGSGVLAAAAVYYTISTSISSSTSSLRSDLHNSANLLSTSLDPSLVQAPSSLIGPQTPSRTPFSQILQSRWNLAIGRTVGGVRETDWGAVGSAVYIEGKGLARMLGGEARKVGEEVQKVVEESKEKMEEVGRSAQGYTRDLGGEEGMVEGKSYTGGTEGVVKAEREVERRLERRLV